MIIYVEMAYGEKKNFKEIGAKFDWQQGEFVVSRNEYKWYNLEYVLIFT